MQKILVLIFFLIKLMKIYFLTAKNINLRDPIKMFAMGPTQLWFRKTTTRQKIMIFNFVKGVNIVFLLHN